MTKIYARDLKESLRTNSFMGEGFEEVLKKSLDNDEDLIIGNFDDSEWRNN